MFQGSRLLEAALFGSGAPSILYACGCARTFPIHDLLYCQECKQVKCPFCIKEEIDSHYCPNCLDNMTSYDALIFKNRCKKCFECPSCFSSLSFVQSSGKSAEDTSEEGRSVYLHCSFCYWDSLALGLQADTPNTLIANYVRRERADPQQIAVNALVEDYQRLARETRVKTRSKQRFVGAQLASPEIVPPPLTPITVNEVEAKLQEKNAKLTYQGLRKERQPPSETNEGTEKEKEEDSNPSSIHEIATLEQRFFDLARQPSKVSEIWPRRRQLLTRHAKWCRGCDKLLIKPDLIAAKIEFKRQHVALFYIPKVTVAPYPSPTSNRQAFSLTVIITNPVSSLMHVSVSDLPDELKNSQNSTVALQPSSISTFVGVGDEYDDLWETEEYLKLKAEEESNKNPSISARHLNKVHLVFNISPQPDAQELKFVLLVKANYTTSTSGEQELEVPVHFNLGTIPTS